jgi:hypothetical protein
MICIHGNECGERGGYSNSALAVGDVDPDDAAVTDCRR